MRHTTTLFLLLVSCFASASATEEAKPTICQVVWVQTPPVIDGKGDDPCWRMLDMPISFPADEFGDEPETTVRVRYDAQNLYILMEMRDSNPRQINRGLPEDLRDTTCELI